MINKMEHLYSILPKGQRPENFINGDKHIVFFYHESDYARNIIYQYLKNGLVKGESCIYATEESPELIEKGMSDFGIDVERFKKENLLHLYLVEPFTDFENAVEAEKRMIKRILADSKPPYRVYARAVPQIDTEQGIEAELKIERCFQSEFGNFDGTVMCPYPLKKIEPTRRNYWMDELIKNHHSVILAPPSGTGFAYDRK